MSNSCLVSVYEDYNACFLYRSTDLRNSSMLPTKGTDFARIIKLFVRMPGDDLLDAVTTGWRGGSTRGAYRLLTWRWHRAGKLLCALAVCL